MHLPIPGTTGLTARCSTVPSLVALSLAALLTTAPAMAQAPGYRIIDRQVLAGPVQWDYLAADGASQRLYLSRGDRVEVVDLRSGRVIGSVPGAGVHGVALAPELDRGYASNGRDNSVTVFRLATLETVATVPTELNPDAIVYDPASRRVFAANGRSGSLTAIDTATNRAVGTIAVGGKLEFATVDGKGRLFVNVEDRNQIAVVDTAALRVVQRFDLGGVCDEPAGLSMDVAGGRLYAGCHNQKMAVVDAVSGKILATPAIGRGSDATFYDAAKALAFSSNGDGTLTVISGSAPYAVQQVLQTMAGARTMALDDVSHRLYLVSAETAAAAATKDVPAPRPTRTPGTFTLLTVAP